MEDTRGAVESGHPTKQTRGTEGQIQGDLTCMSSLGVSNSQRQEAEAGGQGWGRGNGEFVFDGDRVSVWEAEKVLETEGGDDCTTV